MNYISMIILNNLMKFEGSGLGAITTGGTNVKLEFTDLAYLICGIAGIVGAIVMCFNGKKGQSIIIGAVCAVIAVIFFSGDGVEIIKKLFT